MVMNEQKNDWFSDLYKAKKKYVCLQSTDPKKNYAKKKKIDQQNPEIRLRFRVCFRIQQQTLDCCNIDGIFFISLYI